MDCRDHWGGQINKNHLHNTVQRSQKEHLEAASALCPPGAHGLLHCEDLDTFNKIQRPVLQWDPEKFCLGLVGNTCFHLFLSLLSHLCAYLKGLAMYSWLPISCLKTLWFCKARHFIIGLTLSGSADVGAPWRRWPFHLLPHHINFANVTSSALQK